MACISQRARETRRVSREIAVEGRADVAHERSRVLGNSENPTERGHETMLGQRSESGDLVGQVVEALAVLARDRRQVDLQVAHQAFYDLATQTVLIRQPAAPRRGRHARENSL